MLCWLKVSISLAPRCSPSIWNDSSVLPVLIIFWCGSALGLETVKLFAMVALLSKGSALSLLWWVLGDSHCSFCSMVDFISTRGHAPWRGQRSLSLISLSCINNVPKLHGFALFLRLLTYSMPWWSLQVLISGIKWMPIHCDVWLWVAYVSEFSFQTFRILLCMTKNPVYITAGINSAYVNERCLSIASAPVGSSST